MLRQKTPPDVYDDWKYTVDASRFLLHQARNLNFDCLPSWTKNLSIKEVVDILKNLIQEINHQFSLNMIASIEGLFIHQLKFYEKKKIKDRQAKRLRKKFKDIKDQNKYISLQKILNKWTKLDQITEKRFLN